LTFEYIGNELKEIAHDLWILKVFAHYV